MAQRGVLLVGVAMFGCTAKLSGVRKLSAMVVSGSQFVSEWQNDAAQQEMRRDEPPGTLT